MEIVKQGNTKTMGSIYFECANCGCEFICDSNEHETETGTNGVIYYNAKCPCCGKKVWRNEPNEDEEVFTMDNPPKYPDDFFQFGNSMTAKIDDSTINQWIESGIQFFRKNPEEQSYSMACGDAIVHMTNMEDGIHITVCKNYYMADIEP